MAERITTAQFLELFTYERGRLLSTMAPCDRPPYRGACGSFAVTVDKLEGGGGTFWLALSPANRKKRWPLCWLPRHVVLEQKGKGLIESARKRWQAEPGPDRLLLPIPRVWIRFRMLPVWLQIAAFAAIITAGVRLHFLGSIL